MVSFMQVSTAGTDSGFLNFGPRTFYQNIKLVSDFTKINMKQGENSLIKTPRP